jgi:ketosteroid isomerase-like protein
MDGMSEQTDLVTSAYEAFARGDVEGVLGALDPGVRWRVPEVLPHGGAFDGAEDVGRFFAGLAERWDGLDVQADPPIANGDRVAVTGRATGRLKATGEETGYGFVHVWTVRDGRAAAFDEYVDPDPELL